ncbi:Sulfurtransferase TusA [bacterium HR39]|nr:Sulfurtransferase TusA [bacterium HR39]
MEELDLRGLICPLPVLKARKRLAGLPPGARVRILATDPKAREDFRHFCEVAGHRLLAVREEGGGVLVIEIERGG